MNAILQLVQTTTETGKLNYHKLLNCQIVFGVE